MVKQPVIQTDIGHVRRLPGEIGIGEGGLCQATGHRIAQYVIG